MYPALRHFAAAEFWPLYQGLPAEVRKAADKQFALLKAEPTHPSLHFKKIGDLWSARVGLHHRALGIDAPGNETGVLWFWIGPCGQYDRLIKQG